MNGLCEECSSWAQDLYWNHFQSKHFIQILDSDFNSQLMIPGKFSSNAMGKLQETVTLKGPGGSATWHVRLEASGDMLFLKDGWGDFVNAFCLEEKDILIFKYNGSSCFDVLIFDQNSLCEKESSYFIRRCGHLKPASINQKKICLKESPEEITQECSHEDIDTTPQKKPKMNTFGDQDLPSEKRFRSGVSEVTKSKVPCADAGDTRARPRNKTPSFTWVPVKTSSETVPAEKQKLSKKGPNADILAYVSGRGPEIEDQMKKVLQMAQKELTKDSFLLVMRPTHVSRKFYLTLPAEWIATHLNYKKQVVRLHTKDKTWLTRLIFSSRGRGGLSLGWKKFVLDNCLGELDVCVFKPTSEKNDPVLLDVTIFRFASEIV